MCSSIGCRESDRDKDISFHRIPTVRRNYGKRELELSIRRRDGYLAASLFLDSYIDINQHQQIREVVQNIFKTFRCMRIPGVDLWDERNITWLPTLNLGHSKRKQLSDHR